MAGVADGTIDIVIGTHRLLVEGRPLQGSGAAGGGRRAAVRVKPQRANQAAEDPRPRLDAVGHADSAHVTDGGERPS